MKIKIFHPQAIFETGHRSNQEDAIFPPYGSATADSRLFLICDGMGGLDCGEVSSNLVCHTIGSYLNDRWEKDGLFEDRLFLEALDEAYNMLDAQLPPQKKTGTTLVFLCLHRKGAFAAHIGDSRIYHLRPSTNEVLYRSRDHSLVQSLYERGELTYEQTLTAPNRNVINRAMLPHQSSRAKADIIHITDIRPEDYFYICSDGMLENMDDQELLDILREEKTSDEQKTELLRALTADNGDNHSAYLIHIKQVEQDERFIRMSDSMVSVNEGNQKYSPAPTKAEGKKKKAPKTSPLILLVIALVAAIAGAFLSKVFRSNPSKPTNAVIVSPKKQLPDTFENSGKEKEGKPKERTVVVRTTPAAPANQTGPRQQEAAPVQENQGSGLSRVVRQVAAQQTSQPVTGTATAEQAEPDGLVGEKEAAKGDKKDNLSNSEQPKE